MSAETIALLIAQYGLPLVQQLWALKQKGNAPVTQDEFDTLVTLSKYNSQDALAAAGIKIVDGKVVKL